MRQAKIRTTISRSDGNLGAELMDWGIALNPSLRSNRLGPATIPFGSCPDYCLPVAFPIDRRQRHVCRPGKMPAGVAARAHLRPVSTQTVRFAQSSDDVSLVSCARLTRRSCQAPTATPAPRVNIARLVATAILQTRENVAAFAACGALPRRRSEGEGPDLNRRFTSCYKGPNGAAHGAAACPAIC